MSLCIYKYERKDEISADSAKSENLSIYGGHYFMLKRSKP